MKASRVVLGSFLAWSLFLPCAWGAMIDSFTKQDQMLAFRTTPVGNCDMADTGDPSATIGGWRELQMQILSGARTCVAEVLSDQGTFSFTQGTSTRARATMIWDGNGSHGLDFLTPLDANLASGGASGVALDVLGNTRDTTLTFTFYTFKGLGTPAATATVSANIPQLPLNTATTKYFNFADFAATAGFSFSDIDAIQLDIEGSDGNISVSNIHTVVPEPATWSLLAAGALVALAYRRMRSR